MAQVRALLVLALFAAAAASPAAAATVGFDCITDNSASNCAIGEAQLQMDITDEGSNQVRFSFTNTGPIQAIISEIYFDDGALLGIASVINGPGTDFSQGGSPPDLPGGNNASPPFQVTSGFLAGALPSPAQNGVDVGESVAIIFDLIGGFSFADVLDQFADGTVRAGIHVIIIDGGSSESFVNLPVPEPGTALLMLMGLACLSADRRGTAHR